MRHAVWKRNFNSSFANLTFHENHLPPNISLFAEIPHEYEFSYLMTMMVVTAVAIVPYTVFFLMTWYNRTLTQPKNMFKCNFALSAVIYFAGNFIHLIVYFTKIASPCPDIYLLWWSSTGIIASIFLIELDRFLAIRYPLKYPVFMTEERSVVACIGTQSASLVLCIIVRLASPETFSCSAVFAGDAIANRPMFIFVVIMPYFVCLLLSIFCSLFVVKALLSQTHRINRIHSTTIQLTTAQTTLKHRSASHFGDLGITTTTTISNDDDGVKSTSVSTNDVKGSKNDSLELPSSMQLGFKDRFVSPTPSTKSLPAVKRFSERALSYPLEDVGNRRIRSGIFQNHLFRLKISESVTTTDDATVVSTNSTLSELKRDMKSTFKTLSMLFLYLIMSSPSYMVNILLYRDAGTQEGQNLRKVALVLHHISLFGHIAYPYMWFWLDKQYAEKMLKVLKKIFNKWTKS